MYKTVVFVTAIVAGVFLAPVATSAALAEPPGHVAAAAGAARTTHVAVASLPPVQLTIVWALLALIAVVTFFSVRRMLRRGEEDGR
jgi:hypothetical protein